LQYRYFVAGTGMGKTIAHFLLNQPDTYDVTIADLSLARAREVANHLNNISKLYAECRAVEFNIEDSSKLPLFSNYDVVVSALPARYNLKLLQIMLASKTNFCDLGGVLGVTRKMHKFDEDAKKAGIAAVTDNGLMPGLGNIEAYILVREMIRQYGLKKVDAVEILVGGMPQKPRPPVFYQKVFHLDGLKHLCYDNAPIVKDGDIMYARPLLGYERMTISELAGFSSQFNGEVECFISAGAGLAPWHFQDIADNFCEKTIRWPGFVDFVRQIPSMEFKEAIEPHINIPVDAENPDFVWMEVRVSNGSVTKSISILDLFDPETGFTAMERTTGFSAGAVALMIARGRVNKGVSTPECALTEKGLREFRQEIGKWLAPKESL